MKRPRFPARAANYFILDGKGAYEAPEKWHSKNTSKAAANRIHHGLETGATG